MVLQISIDGGLKRIVKETENLTVSQEMVVARSANIAELEKYLQQLKEFGLDIGENGYYEIGYKYLPGQNNQTRLIVFRRKGRQDKGYQN